MNLDDVVKVFQILAYSAAIFGIGFTALNYWKINSFKRGEWLKTLFEKFYEDGSFNKVKLELEYAPLQSYLKYDEKGMATSKENEEAFVNYLNFFELIAILQKGKHLRKSEVKDMFDYYLKSIKKDDEQMKYVSGYGFENLKALLNEYE